MVGKHTTGSCPPIAHQDSNGGQTHHRNLPTNCTPRQQWWANTPQEFAHQLHTRTAMVENTPQDFAHQLHTRAANGGQTHHRTLPTNCTLRQQWWVSTPIEFAHQLHTRTAMVGKHTAELCPPIAHQDSNGGQAHHRTLPTNCTPGQQWWANTPHDFSHLLHTRTAMVGKHTTGLCPPIAHQDSNGGQTNHGTLPTNCTPGHQWWAKRASTSFVSNY